MAELGKDDLFEEHGAEDAKEVVLEYDCCGEEETPTSLETTESHETVGDALQSQPYFDAHLPSPAVNSVEKIVEKSGSQDLGARPPIGVSRIENFELQNHKPIKRKSLKTVILKMDHSQVQTKMCSSQSQTKPL